MSEAQPKKLGRKRLLDGSGMTEIAVWLDKRNQVESNIESPEALCARLGISRSTLTNYVAELTEGMSA